MTKAQKYREVAQFLKDQGWELKRQRGSHEIWSPKTGGAIFSLVQHRGEVSPGVVRQLQKIFKNTPAKWK